MPPGRQADRGSLQPRASSSPHETARASGSASRARPSSSSRSPAASLNGEEDDDDEQDDDAGDGSEDSSALTDEDEEDEDTGPASSSPLKQAHLTPHRPSRARRLPARFEADVPSTVVPLRSSKVAPNQRVTVEVRTGTAKARTKGTFKDLAPIPAGANGDGKSKWVATIVTSDSGSGEGDEEAQRAPQTPSRRGRGKEKSPEVETPSRRKRTTQVNGHGQDPPSSRPTTPSKAKAAASAASGSRSNQTTPKSHPKPIKRPKLDGAPPSTPRRRKSAASLGAPSPSTAAVFEPTKPFLQPTSADYYFAAHAARRRSAASKSDSWAASGGRRIEDELPALTSKEVAKLSFSSSNDPLSSANIGALALEHYRQQYVSWTSLLFMGNDLIFYGLGAKEAILEDFAASKAEEGEAAVVIIRGRMGVRSEEWVESIEEALDLGSAPASQSGIEGRLRRIAATLEEEGEEQAGPPRLILVLHSLDSPSFLTPRTRSHLATLAAFSRKVHLVCSVTHPNGTLLSRYTGREALWIDCTTLTPMLDDCLLSASGTRLGGLPRAFDLRAGGGMGGLTGMGSRDKTTTSSGAAAGGTGEGQMTSAAEAAGAHANTPLLSSTAALHVLKSVTTKARALFLRLAAELTSPSVVAAAAASSSATSLASRSIPYARLSNLAARNFIATTDPALRALLVEFTSHGLVRLAREEAPGGGAVEERVSIRMGGQVEVDEVVKGVKTLPG